MTISNVITRVSFRSACGMYTGGVPAQRFGANAVRKTLRQLGSLRNEGYAMEPATVTIFYTDGTQVSFTC